MNQAPLKHVVVSPVRDEEAFIDETVRCMLAQTVRPVEWVLVNDGSTDGTGEILDRYAGVHPWIRVVHRRDRGFRAAGHGVMEAFHAGYATLETTDWEFLTKLDGDLSFGEDYFEHCLREFSLNPKLGIAGGVIYNKIGGSLRLEHHPRFHVRGATKIYKRACWEDIGGLRKVTGWDTLDEVRANMLGWETRSFPAVSLVQQRFTGDAAGQWSNWVKNGRASYITGYHPLFLFAKAVRRMVRKPYLVASVGLVYGYVRAFLTGVPQIDDPPLIAYLKQQQMRRLLGRPSIWR